nr:CatB-related O-acetyltransferase [Winogradskyella aurantiaca]
MIISRLLQTYRKLFRRNNSIRLGAELKNTVLGYNINISRYSFISNSSIDNYTSIGRNTVISNANVGKFCSISWNVTIGATQHNYKKLSTHAFTYIKYYGFTKSDHRITIFTEIGNDVWIGANAIIMPGVTIGNGAVIGAGSIVTKNVEPYQIVVGNPARQIGYRFSQKKIEYVKGLQWWDWEESKLKEKIHLFQEPIE